MTKGFYGLFPEEDQPKKIEYELSETGPNCSLCGLIRNCKSPKMEHSGEGKLECLIIAEAPGPDEDEYGTQLIGRIGQFFREKLTDRGLDLDRDFFKANAINCFPNVNGKIREPTIQEISYCRPIVEGIIRETKPKFIWLIGNKAITSVLGEDFSNRQISRWRGLCIPDRKTGAYIIPMFHPSYVSRNERDSNLMSQYDRDLDFAIECLEKRPFGIIDDTNSIDRIYRYEDAIALLKDFCDQPPDELFIDFETTGLKPYIPGHKIVSVSLCEEEDIAYSFPLQYRDYWLPKELQSIMGLLRKILTNERIKKQAHNIKYEDEWSSVILNCDIINWDWDSMLSSRIIDNRSGFSGLKFQSFINFGVRPYDKHLRKYIEGSPFNEIEKIPIDQLLLYGGQDGLYGKRLTDLHKNQLTQTQAYDLFHQGTLEFSKIQQNGIHMDEEYYHTQRQTLREQVRELEKKLTSGEDAKKFREHTGYKLKIKEKDFSSKDLGILFYEVLGAKPVYTDKTKDLPVVSKRNYSVSAETLEGLKFPFVEDLIKLRQLKKTSSTYLGQYIRETYKGKMHPSFDLVVPKSYRSSSSNPNFQNVPVREEEAKRVCRSGVMPTQGWQILEADLKSIEVSIGACYHKDPNMIKYLTDETTDMHRDTASDIWMLRQDNVTDFLRYLAKNGWVFPQFYGSYYANCAKDLWNRGINAESKLGIVMADHLSLYDINDYRDFEEHCREVENIFWKKRFKVYDQWREEVNEIYRETGYIETFFGFQFRGYITKNEAANYPIQGTAFHVLLWILIKFAKWLRKEKLKSKIIGQIHDSIVVDSHPKEKEQIIHQLRYLSKRIREIHDWIIIPIGIDIEISPINKSWYEKEKYGTTY